MSKSWQFYYNTLFGAIGGLVAWLTIGMVPTGPWQVHLANAFVGAGIGLFIGGALGTVEGLVIKRSFWRTLFGVASGVLLGAFGGALGLLLGGLVFIQLQGGFIGRILGWTALGFFLGTAQGVMGFNLRRFLLGMTGGTLAGLVGGALYEFFTQAFLQQSEQAQLFLSALGLVLLGTSLGIIIPLTIDIARQGLIRVLDGRRAGSEISVIGPTSLGSSDACDVYIPDEQVEKRQAMIKKGGSGFMIHNLGSSQVFYLNKSPLQPGSQAALRNGDRIQLGAVLIQFITRGS
jgi:hypothetical protein